MAVLPSVFRLLTSVACHLPIGYSGCSNAMTARADGPSVVVMVLHTSST